jgi:hypothetical protein
MYISGQSGVCPHVTHLPLHFLAVLAKDGHKVILEEIEYWNVVELLVNEEIVFQCNIKDLEFGKPRSKGST